jgi:hypothetical protein
LITDGAPVKFYKNHWGLSFPGAFYLSQLHIEWSDSNVL